MNHISFTTIVLPLIISVLGSILATYYFKNRDKRLRKKLEEVDDHEVYIEKLSKGNTKLLRSSLIFIFGVLFAISLGMSSLIINNIVILPLFVRTSFMSFSLGCLIGAVYICMYQVKSIVQSSNLKEAREELEKKREKLKSKII